MATVTSTRPYHIIIFGASGFTGQFVVEEVARSAFEGPSGSLKWALAGRSRQRLEGVLNQAAETLQLLTRWPGVHSEKEEGVVRWPAPRGSRCSQTELQTQGALQRARGWHGTRGGGWRLLFDPAVVVLSNRGDQSGRDCSVLHPSGHLQ
ncbi:uncharacterized protein LOC118965511 isoform X2 [Oncorhynchus mykiss]|uniref:uncharacterized protein LOC118965510 isoform X2 n=1 Tax=Oncorhynchus mykiss TaxID=8022 RepID=UPI0018782E3A|nr:uncharacterized protein LOC118965510 isoform X2 [Oncorhynchus mykiss]XP_036841264.1 uncharacterized protein LOC118965511 isoform X2 [Oncorhynchus mykiss]